MLGECGDITGQIFRITVAGAINPGAAPGLPTPVADGNGAEGGGARPVYPRRTISLEPCSEDVAARQRWQLRARAPGADAARQVCGCNRGAVEGAPDMLYPSPPKLCQSRGR